LQGQGPYSNEIKQLEDDIMKGLQKVKELAGVRDSDMGLSPPSMWDLVADRMMMAQEQPLHVAMCTKILNPGTEDAKYVIDLKQIAKFVVGLGEKLSPTDIEESMRVGVDRQKY